MAVIPSFSLTLERQLTAGKDREAWAKQKVSPSPCFLHGAQYWAFYFYA